MALTNTKAQDLVTEAMDKISKDTTLSLAEKASLLARLNNSMVRNSHVQIRAARLASTMGVRKQTSLPNLSTLLQMPVLK